MTILESARRRARGDDDGGFALIFVLFVAVMVMIGTAAMLTVTTGNIRPAKQSQDSYAAQAAAQSGIQDWVATLNAYCRNDSIQTCAYLASHNTLSVSLGNGQSYVATVLNPTNYIGGNAGAVRVRSTGTVGTGSTATTRQLVADISGVPSVLRFTYFTNYETLGKTFLDSYYGPRTIPLTADAAAAAGVPSGSTITWKGTSTAPSNGYTDDVCDALYYADPTNPTSVAQGRAAAAMNRTGLPAGTNFSEDGFTRTPTQQLLSLLLPNAKSDVPARNAACEVTFTKGMNFTGPVYSRDALYLSNGVWGGSTGPSFTIPDRETTLPAVSTGWLTTAVPASNATTPYRSDAQLGGTPTTDSTSTAQLVKPTQQRFALPSTASPDGTCTYTGPTRIKLRTDGSAEVTSPLTTATAGSTCYTANGSGAGVKAVVPIDSTVLKVDDAASTASTTTPSFADLPLGAANDITTYSPTRGDAYVEGTLGGSARLSIVTANDIVVTGDLRTTSTTGTNSSGETSWTSGAAVDLVATNNVRLYHPVACASGTARDGYCPNDISGLYTTTQAGTVVTSDGTLRDVHPSLQYCSIVSGTRNCSADKAASSTPDVEIDAAVVALRGSLLTDNFNRGRSLGTALVKGGVYANHRGATGQQWEIPTLTSTRHNSGYKLQLSYVSYEFAGLPYVPVLEAGQSVRPWFVLNVSTGGTP